MKQYTIGIDFGTLSGRAVLMNIYTGEVVASSVYTYPHAVIDETLNGTPLPLNTALQNPEDYLGVLRTTIRSVLNEADISPDEIIGLGYDFTSCTILPVDEKGIPLCFLEKYLRIPEFSIFARFVLFFDSSQVFLCINHTAWNFYYAEVLSTYALYHTF